MFALGRGWVKTGWRALSASPRRRSTHSINGTVVAASRLWELGDKLSRVLGQRRDTPGNEKWSGRWESNPRLKLGKLGYYHYTTPAPLFDSSRLSEDQATFSFWFGVADIPGIRQGFHGLARA